jgi:carbon-monoxide dehydrogenase small subunit
MRYTLTLNGTPVEVEAPAGIPLLRLLRDYCGLTGTKEGCAIGECGACSVLLDGKAIASCLTLATQASGREVTTVEGLSPADGQLSPTQAAFVEAGAVQCGYCMPGLIVATEALLSQTPDPTREEIRAAIGGNLCRCTGYQQIIDSIAQAAARRAEAAQEAQS